MLRATGLPTSGIVGCISEVEVDFLGMMEAKEKRSSMFAHGESPRRSPHGLSYILLAVPTPTMSSLPPDLDELEAFSSSGTIEACSIEECMIQGDAPLCGVGLVQCNRASLS